MAAVMMFDRTPFILLLFLGCLCGSHLPARAAARPASLHVAIHDEHTVLTSTSTQVRFKVQAGTDTFALYGGPGSLEGRFQEAFGNVPDPQGWITVDRTDDRNAWQASGFNAANLDSQGPSNLAYWCGQAAEQRPGWGAAPGYGNGWNDGLIWTSGPIADPAAGQVVELDFFFNYDLEPRWDFFVVEYEKGDVWVPVYEVSGSNKAGPDRFDPPGVQYATVDHQPIVFDGADYGGRNRNEIRIRLRVSTDGSGSDQDGLWPSSGAAQVDQVSVAWTSNGPRSSVTGFEGDGPHPWKPEKSPFAGDFAKLFFDFDDIDPCRDNRTPAFNFVDDGTPPSNPSNQPPIQNPPEDTGGTLTATWSYGVPGGWVVNYNGGLTNGLKSLYSEIWSPLIAWDLAGENDDGADVRGAVVRFSVWRHLPIQNGIFYVWHVRSSTDGGASWTAWRDRGIVYWDNGNLQWYNHEVDVTEYVEPSATHVQLALGARDLADLFGYPGNDATPAPLFDNAAFLKYRVTGPLISVRPTELFNDVFPQSGQAVFDTPAQRDAADCRLDMGYDTNASGMNIVAGDSIAATIDPIIAGTTLESAKMVWVLDRNPLFDDVRQAPPGVTEIVGGAANGWNQWTGEVAAQPVPALTNRYFFDLPDQDFMYPGDVLRTYLWARDSLGNESTLPRSLDGFADGTGYDRTFTVRALPSVVDDGQGGLRTPEILFINGFGRGPAEEVFVLAYQQNGWTEGAQYDTYAAQGPTARVSNGIGSAGAHGATPAQLAFYSVILYAGEDLRTLLSDGTNTGTNDKSDDIGVLSAWQEQPADRFMVAFGDNIASALQASGPAGLTYAQTILGIEFMGSDVRGQIDGQRAPTVLPQASCLLDSYVAYGSCDQLRFFDNIGPLGTGAVRGHGFALASNPDQIYAGPGRAASVLWDREGPGGARNVNLTFPHGFGAVRSDVDQTSSPSSGSRSVRAELLREILFDCFGRTIAGGSPVGTEEVPQPGLSRLVVYPNPFNPRTTIAFHLNERALVTVSVHDVRGAHVATIHHGHLTAGPHQLAWDGTDARGRTVASGIYFLRLTTDEGVHRRKLLLIK